MRGLVSILTAATAAFAQHVQVSLPLHELSTSSFSVFSHPSYPKHRVRAKRTNGWCEGSGANVITGYIDVEVHHLFFYFFESRNEPNEDPVVMWINGGPGGSSAMGLFDELGPCSIGETEIPKHNPYSWSNNASVIFLDQPVGVGWSYADHGETVRTTEDAAVDVAAFLAIFLHSFSQFRGLEFHLTGESYAGRYIPVFAAELFDANSRATAQGETPVNIQSVAIGNAFTSLLHMSMSAYDLLCTHASIEPLLPISECVQMKAVMPHCEKWFTKSCFDTHDEIACGAASNFCFQELFLKQTLTKRDPYDLTYPCDETPEPNDFCYRKSEDENVTRYLNRPDVRALLGVDDAAGNFSMSNMVVNQNFANSGDLLRSSRAHIEQLLERGVRVLNYAGTLDFMANHVGNIRFAHELEWTGAAGFKEASLREWTVGGHKAGLVKSFGPLTFATVDGASHLVPREKPEESLAMINRWLTGEPL